ATLDEALAACGSMALVDVEVKHLPGEPDHDPAHGPALAVAALVARWRGPVLVTSFDPAALATVRRAGPEVPTGRLLPPGPLEARPAVEAAARAGHAAVLPHASALAGRLAGEVVAAARGAGLLCLPWTVDEAGEL